MRSLSFFIICLLHSAMALICGASMMFNSYDFSVFGPNTEISGKFQGSTPHEQLLIQTSYSFSGLLLFCIGLLLFMVAFVKDRQFHGFFAKGCLILHVAMVVWRFSFEMKLDGIFAWDWARQVAGEIALGLSWVFFLLHTCKEKDKLV